jgi:hypothetical protein
VTHQCQQLLIRVHLVHQLPGEDQRHRHRHRVGHHRDNKRIDENGGDEREGGRGSRWKPITLLIYTPTT